MNKKLLKKQTTKTQINWMVAITALVALLLLFALWYNKSYLNPSNVFWGTMSNNLSIDFVTRTTQRSEGTQKLTQVNDIMFSPKLIARSTVRLEDTSTNERVVTETIGTTTTDYLRYVEIKSNKSGGDTSAIGVWSKNEAPKDQQPQILPDALLGSVLMFGNLSSSQSNQIIEQLKSTNAFDKYDLIGKKNVNGRTVYSYNVVINLDAYSKVYAEYLKMLGQDKLATQISQQQSGSKYNFTLELNGSSRVPMKLSVPGDSSTETYSNVGGGPRFTTPQATLTIADLQAKLRGQ